MRIISENIANADSTASSAGTDPYRRKMTTFKSEMDRALDARGRRGGVRVGEVFRDNAHAPGLCAQPRGSDRDGFQEVHDGVFPVQRLPSAVLSSPRLRV